MLTNWRAAGHLAVLAAAAVLLAVQTPLLVSGHEVAVGVALVVTTAHTAGAPLALWRPRVAAAASVVGALATMLVLLSSTVGGWPWGVAPMLTQLLVLLVLALVGHWRLAAWTLGVLVAGSLAVALAGTPWHDVSASGGNIALFTGLAMLVGALGGIGGRFVEITEALRQERTISAEENARRMVVEEKSRIARELHDVIAHTMSLITVQARSAPHRIDGVTPEAEAEFTQIAERAAEALTQMRGVLGVLRTEPGQAGRTPVPGLRELPELVASVRETGQQVEVHGEVPEETAVDDEVGAAAYRIVQQALSNARQHSPGQPVRLDLRTADGELEVGVRNPLERPAVSGTDGHGLIGMRERATAVGGTLRAGELTPGQYDVRARLPLHRARTEPDEVAR